MLLVLIEVRTSGERQTQDTAVSVTLGRRITVTEFWFAFSLSHIHRAGPNQPLPYLTDAELHRVVRKL